MNPIWLLLLTPLLAGSWPHYGGSHSGDRYAREVRVSPKTVHELRPAWTFRTGDATDGEGYFSKPSNFKATPILVADLLVFPTGFNRILAVEAATGRLRWRFDPQVDFSHPYSEQFTARGVEVWTDPQAGDEVCRHRIFMGTLDARLIAVDATTGRPCLSFGQRGQVDLSQGINNVRREDYSVTSPPLAIGDIVVVGSSVGDNGAAQLESGVVRGYDARSGRLRWRFDPAPSGAGGANVWSAMSADAERGLIFLPTTSPSPDFFGGHRSRDDGHANSLVALDAPSGRLAWSYRVVRHDLWDYDLASQPLLLDWPVEGRPRPAVAVATKMGFVYVVDRQTGRPLIRVDERPVPKSDVRGEAASSTQRFSSIQLHPVGSSRPKLWALSPEQLATCQRMMKGVRFEGIFTPPSLQGTLLYPGNAGGTNWGAIALDPARGTMLMAVNRLPTVVKLIPRAEFRQAAKTQRLNGARAQYTAMAGTPYGMARFDVFDRKTKAPCFEGPWAQLVAVDVKTGRVKWSAPAGRWPAAKAGTPASTWGYFAHGGPLVTGGGLTFLATSFDNQLRAYATDTGRIVWQHALPAGAHATPMAYPMGAEEFVVIATGGDLSNGSGRGDHLVAFKRARRTPLPRP